jgi:hypothetical protein
MTNYREWTFRFGKYKGETFGDVYETDREYVEWLHDATENETIKKALGSIINSTVSDTVKVNRKRYEELMADSEWLGCLIEAGVDNWSGFQRAKEIRDGL